ncbi:MAG: transcriptional repressor LexA [Clostridiales bacterium]|nr:transcriptional repressor LexA [Clostridiales bacterium]
MRHKDEKLMEQIFEYVEQFTVENLRSPTTTEIAKAVKVAQSTAYKYLVAMRERGMLSYKDGIISTKKTRNLMLNQSVAVAGSVSCGLPQLEEENIEEYITLPASLIGKGEFYVVHANGDSMVGAGIDDNDMVLVRKQTDANYGDLVIALVENENTLKRYMYDNEKKRPYLHPENPDFEDIYPASLSIQGVAVHVIKRLR